MLLRFLGKPGGEDKDQHGSDDDAHYGQGEKHHAQGAGDPVQQFPDLRLRPGGLVFGEHGNKGLGERALGKQAAEEIRYLERHHEHVHSRARAERPGKDDVAQKPQDAGRQRVGAHHAGGAQQAGSGVLAAHAGG